MKYIVAISLIAVLLSVGVLSACDGIGESSMPTPTPQATATPTSVPQDGCQDLACQGALQKCKEEKTAIATQLFNCGDAKNVCEGKLVELGLHIPTGEEVRRFVKEDETNVQLPIMRQEATKQLIENSMKGGISAYCVMVQFPGIAWIMVGFPTIDEGMLYLGATTDVFSKFEVNKKVDELNHYILPLTHDGTILAITVLGYLLLGESLPAQTPQLTPAPQYSCQDFVCQAELDKCRKEKAEIASQLFSCGDVWNMCEARLIETSLRIPTSDEVKRFVLEGDDTNKLPTYFVEDADSQEKSRVLIENAKKKGIAAYFALVNLSSISYWLVGFPTTDAGMLYVYAPWDKFYRFEVGKKADELNDEPYPGYDTTILSLNVFGYVPK